MKLIPVDTNRMQFLVVADPRPVTDRAGQPRTDSAERALVQVSLIAVMEGEPAETLTVKVAGPVPQLGQLTPVRVAGLTARAWAIDGNSGVSFNAVSITPTTAKQA